MPSPLSVRAGTAPIAFRSAAEIAAANGAASTHGAPAADPPPGFRPAAAPVSVDALLDRFEAAPASDPPASGGAALAVREQLERPVLLYNEQCEVCQVLSAWVKRTDAKGKDLIDERPIPNDPQELARLNPNLDIWQVYEEIHVLMPDGRALKGGAAIAEVLRRLPYASWLGPIFDAEIAGRKPGTAALHAAYKFLDAIRPALGCSSCGGGPVAWWAKPIKWIADAVKLMMPARAQ